MKNKMVCDKKLQGSVWGIVLLYGLLYWISQWDNPLLLNPQLDGKEILNQAADFSEFKLPQEPFYRAPLYPLFLSVFILMGFGGIMGWVISAVGLLIHFMNTFLVGRLSFRLWNDRRASILSILIFGLNPVVLFFSLQPLDIAFSILLVLLGLCFILSPASTRWEINFIGSLFLGLAVLARPHFIVLGFGLLLLSFIISTERKFFFVRLLGWSLPLFLFGSFQFIAFNDFRILPWQGSYNLYAANRAGSNGLYYIHQLDLPSQGAEKNPARLESEILYADMHSEETEFSIEKFNTYWKSRAFNEFREDPLRLVRLFIFKGYALLNNWETYNNYTYSYHKSENIFLKYNFIGFGVLLVFVGLGLFVGGKGNARILVFIGLPFFVYALGVALYYASARFRLPLYIPLSLFAPAALVFFQKLKAFGFRKMTMAAGVVLALGGLTFSNFGGIKSEKTFIQDELAIANSAAELGRDELAVDYALRALNRDGTRSDAIRIGLISYFNLQTQSDNPDFKSSVAIRLYKHGGDLVHTDAVLDFVMGVYSWNLGFKEKAIRLWKESARKSSNSVPVVSLILEIEESKENGQVDIDSKKAEVLKKILPGLIE